MRATASVAALCLCACEASSNGPVVVEMATARGPAMEAMVSGTLNLDGPCVALGSGDAPDTVLFFRDSTRIGTDGGETVVLTNGHVFRHGDAVRGGGGRIDDLRTWAEMELAEVYPRGCSDAGVQLYDLEPAR